MLDGYLWEARYFTSARVSRSNLQVGKDRLKSKASQMRERGVRIADLSSYIIERPYGSVRSPPENVLEAVRRAVESGWPEPDLRGISSLRRTIAEVEGKKGIDVDPDSEVIVTGGGAMQGLYNTLQAILDPGDEVMVFGPGLSFDEHVKLAGGIPIYLELKEEDGYRFDPEAIEKAISPRTKVMILNTPHNPTGHVATREELEGLADLVKRKRVIVISDEVVWKWVYDGHEHISFASLPDMRDRTIIVSSVTKSGMFDWRIGWVIGNPGLIERVEKVMFWQNEFSSPLLQVAAEAHLSGLDRWIRPIVEEQERKRDVIYSGLVKAGYRCFKPQGHLTVFPNISSFMRSSVKFAEYLLDKGRVLVSPGIAYLGEGHIRVGFHKSLEEIRDAVERMRAVADELQREASKAEIVASRRIASRREARG